MSVDTDQLRRVAIVCLAAAAVIAIVSTAVALAAVDWDFEALTFGDPERILSGVPQAAVLWRWGVLGDMFYSYLLLVPLALFIHRRLRERRPWLADLGLSGALAYTFIGGAAAAIIATGGSSLIASYAAAAPAQQSEVAADFRLFRDIFYFGIWQTLDPITAGTWVSSTGWLLLSNRPVLGRLLVTLGGALWAMALMTMLDIHSLVVVAALVAAAGATWLAWIALARGPRTPVSANG